MKTTIVKDLLDLGDSFEQAYPNPDDQTTAMFLAWAHTRQAERLTMAQAPVHTYYSVDVPVTQTFMAHLITNLYHYFRLYVKKAFEHAPLLTFDDFIALAILARQGSMIKTDLVEATINEKTSGMLVIKRLIDNRFVEQTDGGADRRTRAITITEAGLATLRAFQPAMNEATALFRGDLTEAEQQQIILLLNRLKTIHHPIYKAHLSHKDRPLAELARLMD